jgi:hypothetical protein
MPFEDVVNVVGQHLPGDAIVTVDTGIFGAPTRRVIPVKPPQRLLAPISGAMVSAFLPPLRASCANRTAWLYVSSEMAVSS